MATTTLTSTFEAIELEPLPNAKTQQPPPEQRSSLQFEPSTVNVSTISSPPRSNLQIVFTIFMPSFVGFLASFSSGIITVGLPDIAHSLSLDRSLYLWPSSVYGLTAGSTLLIAGSIADIIGARPVELLGISLLGTFALACGFASNGTQLVVFRALQGVALAMHLPASVALIAGAVPSGRARNLGFACLGFSQPLGFAFGLVIGGVLIDRAGWRSGFYLCGSATLLAAVGAIWSIPQIKTGDQYGFVELCKQVGRKIDWIGGLISSGGLATLAYVLAILSADLRRIRSVETAVLLAASIVMLGVFPVWMNYRERTGKSALVPNKIWKGSAFTSTCIMIALSWAVTNSIELFSSLYFQEIQHASTITTSLYLLPNLGTGVILNLLVGTFVHRMSARWLIAGSSIICALSPLSMALLNPAWNYWYLAFWAQVAAPFSNDVLFTVGLIIVSDTLPEETQALAGAVFNTVAQIGLSLGMGTCQVVALGVQGEDANGQVHESHGDSTATTEDEATLLRGYRASFWTMFAYMALCAVVAIVGLRKTGRVGLKRD